MSLPVEITFTINDVPYLISRCFDFTTGNEFYQQHKNARTKNNGSRDYSVEYETPRKIKET